MVGLPDGPQELVPPVPLFILHFYLLVAIAYVFMPMFVFCSSSSLLSLLFLRGVFSI